jgi:hypothetical protein
MADQVDPDTVGGTTLQDSQADAGAVAEPDSGGQVAQPQAAYVSDPGQVHAAYHGRPISWVAASIILVGFVAGGLGLVLGPNWLTFWIGCGIVVIGSILAVFTDMFDDWY